MTTSMRVKPDWCAGMELETVLGLKLLLARNSFMRLAIFRLRAFPLARALSPGE